MATRIALITPTRYEYRWATRPMSRPAPGRAFVFAGRQIVTGVVGVGAQRARQGLSRLLGDHRIDQIVLAGFAGGLDPAVGIGAVIEPACLIDEQGRSAVLTEGPAKIATAPTDKPAANALLCVSRLIATADEKRALFEAYHALAADMESLAIAELAAEHGLPLKVIRTISDAAADPLPRRLLDLADRSAAAQITGMLGEVIAHPSTLGPLIRLFRHARHAGRALADAVGRHMQAGV